MPYAPSESNSNRRRSRRRIGLYVGSEKEMSCAFIFVQLSEFLIIIQTLRGSDKLTRGVIPFTGISI
jgi:hypothetical protein